MCSKSGVVLMKKEVHLLDLSDKVFVKMNVEYREDFFNLVNAHRNFKIFNFANFRKGKTAVSLKRFKEFLKILPKNKRKIFRNSLENNLIEVRYGSSKSIPIKNPKFPIKFSEDLAKICGHVIGDGGIVDRKNDKRVHYTNQDYGLVYGFRDVVLRVFGDVKFNIYFRELHKTKMIRFPAIVGHILNTFFGIQVGDKKHIPKIIMNSNKKIKSVFLRALYDDEGCVCLHKRSRFLNISMDNEGIIYDVRKILLKDFDIKILRVYKISRSHLKNRKDMYTISICYRAGIKTFKDEIGFNHVRKSRKIKEMCEGYVLFVRRRGDFRRLVIETLKKHGEMDIYEVYDKLDQKSIPGLRKDLWTMYKRDIIKTRLSMRSDGKHVRMYYI
jgi:hypothetical protein